MPRKKDSSTPTVGSTEAEHESIAYMDKDIYRKDGSYIGKLRVNIGTWGGSRRCHIRQWYPSKEPGVYSPGKGVSLELEDVEPVLYALGLVVEDVRSGRLSDPTAPISPKARYIDADGNDYDPDYKPDQGASPLTGPIIPKPDA